VYDLLITGGAVLDPGGGVKGRLDIAVEDGRIAWIGTGLPPAQAEQTLDVGGRLVVPGLIDLHAHAYGGVVPIASDPDVAGVYSGVTTVVDAGSAGVQTLPAFLEMVVPRARTEVIPFVNIGRAGILNFPPVQSPADVDVPAAIRAIQRSHGCVRGVKFHAMRAAFAAMGIEVMRAAGKIARETGVPLMVHIGDWLTPEAFTGTQELLPLMERGDIVTHMMTRNPGRLLDQGGGILPELMAARERGVYLDAAHGNFHMDFDVARRLLDQGIFPDAISTDNSVPGRKNTFHSLTECMSRFMALGLTLEQVVQMTTASPARILQIADRVGSLARGKQADITVLELWEGEWEFADTSGNRITGRQALVPAATLKKGRGMPVDWGPHPWGWLPRPGPTPAAHRVM
jgi:dihydroorotase